MPNTKRILVVDYEPDWQVFVTQVLRKDGYAVALCHDAQCAFQEIIDDNFDLIIIDALFARLLRTLGLEQVEHRLLVVTAAQSVPEAVSAFRWGALDYVSKAFEVSSLLAIVRDLLQQQRTRQGSPV
jgi:DNA-binding response OmpR family regulator